MSGPRRHQRGDRTGVLSLRIKPELRERLEAACERGIEGFPLRITEVAERGIEMALDWLDRRNEQPEFDPEGEVWVDDIEEQQP